MEKNKQIQVILINSLVNIALTALKVVVGIIFKSQLLIADGLHSASDLLTDLFSYVGLKLSQKPKDKDHPFGHGSLEYAASLTVSVVIFVMVYGLIKELVTDWNSVTSNISLWVFVAAVFTFVAKYLLSSYVLRQAKKLDSHTLKSSGIESRADAISTLVVIGGLLVSWIGIEYDMPLLKYGDKVATIFVILMLIKAGGEIYWNSIVGIAGTTASEETTTKIRDRVIAFDNKLIIRDMLVVKQGVQYGVLLKMTFDRSTHIADVADKINSLRNMLYEDDSITKVSIEFDVK